jgi:hypothetical protein
MSGTENLYIIDTSSLIELQRQYPPDIFPSVWEHIHDIAVSRRLVAPVEVKKELLEGYDILLQWVSDHDFIFQEVDDDLIIKTQEVLTQFPRLADAESDKLHHADPFVVALALTMRDRPQQTLTHYKICVVTNEKGKLSENPRLHPNNMKKIPDACSRLGIDSTDHFGLFREENWSF